MCALTSRLGSEVGRFKGKDAATAICPCLGVFGIAADDVADKRAPICASGLCRRGKAGRIGQERGQGHSQRRQAALEAVDLRRNAAVVERGRVFGFKRDGEDTER